MKIKGYILLIPLLLTACGRRADSPRDSHVVLSERISNQNVRAFEEDASGHIWIGTERGLNKYDSRDFHQYFNYSDSIGLADNQINSIFRDSKGGLFVATSGGVCYLTRQGEFKRVSMEDPDAYILQILELPDGRILFGSPVSLGVLNRQTGRIEVALSGLMYSTFTVSPDGSLWCTEFERISRINPSSLEIEESVPSPFKIYHSCMMPDSTLWVSGIGNLGMLDTRTMELKPLPAEIRSSQRLMGADVNNFLLLRDSTLLINTTDDGMFLYDSSRAHLVYQDSPDFPYEAPSRRVYAIFEDSSLNLWTGIEDGGFTVSRRLSPDSYPKRVMEEYFKGKSVTCLCPDEKGNFWVGTATGDLYYCNPVKVSIQEVSISRLVADPKGYKQVNSMVVDSRGDVWLVFSSKWRVLRCSFDGRALRVQQSFEMMEPVSIEKDLNGNVWIGTLYGDVSCYSHSSLTVTTPGNAYSSALCLLPLPDGGVLVGKLNQPLSILGRPGGKAPGYTRKSALDSCLTQSGFFPSALLMDSAGDLWIGTRRNGLLRFRSATNKMEKIEGLSCSDISAIREDSYGNVWISTLYGLCLYNRAKGKVSSLFESDGLGGSQFNRNASCMLPDGTLIFGGTHGLSVIRPGDEAHVGLTRLVFEDLKVFGRIVEAGEGQPIREALEYKPEIVLPKKMNGFSISFSVPDFTGGEHIEYSYMLDGVDRYWIDAGRANEANYSNVSPGRYTFRVRACETTGKEILASDAVMVRILPSPWLRWWAILLYVLAVSVMVAFAIRMRRKLRRAQMEKEQADKEKAFLLDLVREYQKKETLQPEDSISTSDRAFLDELAAIMKESITSPELDIDSITARLKMSRAKFFYKVKKLTGETPGSFFRIYKLNRAATLLKEGKYNISEITDRTGFSSVSHFSTSFKKRYGVSPKEYKG